MAKLIIQTGKLAGKPLTIPSKDVIIGRDEGCFIRMGSVEISRRHCSLKMTPEGILVTDLGSSNGTHVNEIAISQPTVLRAGDRLRVGPAVFLVDGPKPMIDDSVIDDWLNDGDSKAEIRTDGDTAIFRTNPPPAHEPHSVPVVPAVKIKKSFQSTADEAQYVIALYRERQTRSAELDAET